MEKKDRDSKKMPKKIKDKNNKLSVEQLKEIGIKKINEAREARKDSLDKKTKDKSEVISMMNKLSHSESHSTYHKVYEIQVNNETLKEFCSIIANQLRAELPKKEISGSFYLVTDDFSDYRDRIVLSPINMFFAKENNRINLKEIATTKMIYAIQEHVLVGKNEKETEIISEETLVNLEDKIHDSIYSLLFLRNNSKFELIKDSNRDPYEVFDFINNHMVDDFMELEEEIEKIARGEKISINSKLAKSIDADSRKFSK